jgi:DNA-binding response OmpR family regulator
LILTDARLPLLDGFETTRELRTLGCTAPILMFSPSDCQAERRLAFDCGCTDYLFKSGTADDLTVILQRCLEEHRLSPVPANVNRSETA